MKVTGNSILITGGTSGIGLGFAERFLSLGNKVIICGRREDRLQQIQATYKDIIVKRTDVSDAGQREELASWVIQQHPDTNIVINNAGIQLLADLKKPVSMERVRQEVEINLIAPIHLSSLFAAHLQTKENAAIINISSGLAFSPLAFMPVYCATKAAVHSMTLSLRYQLKDTNVNVFEIAPPAVDTELGHDRRADKSKTHGGIPVASFLDEAFEALEQDRFEAPIAMAKNLHEKREAAFEAMNSAIRPS